MSKMFLLKGTGCPIPLTPSTLQPANHINWALCAVCQQGRSETLTDPTLTKRKDAGGAYKSLAESLLRMNELNKLPRNIQIEKLGEGDVLEAALAVNKARWHQSCRLVFNKTKVPWAEKRALKKSSSTGDDDTIAGPSKHARGRTSSTEKPAQEALCFFCCKPAGTDGFHKATTFQLDKRVRECAELLQVAELLARLSAGDMITLEAKYHTKCLVGLYNCARKHKTQEMRGPNEKKVLSGIAC